MNDFIMELLTTLRPAFLTLIEGAAAVAVPFLLWKLNEWMKAKVHDARFHCAMDKVTTHAEAAVLDTFQSYTKAVRKTGKWDGEAAKVAKDKGLEKLKKLMGPAGMAEIKGCLGQDDEGVQGLLESALETTLVKFKRDGVLPDYPNPVVTEPPPTEPTAEDTAA